MIKINQSALPLKYPDKTKGLPVESERQKSSVGLVLMRENTFTLLFSVGVNLFRLVKKLYKCVPG